MRRCVSGLCAVLGLAIVASAVWAADGAKPKTSTVNIGADKEKKITAAAPDKATVAPTAKRKLLACTRSVGFQHGSIPVCAKMLEILGNKSGAWETVISDDLAMFEPENLKEFDGVFFCVTTGPIFGDFPSDKAPNNNKDAERMLRLRKSLVDFVKGGKGLGGNHGATDANYNWKDWGDMFGAYFSEHPFGDIVVKNDDPKHPLNAAFKGEGFPFRDEMYVFGPKPQGGAPQPYSREKLRVLLSIDMAASTKLPNKGPRPDQDYAISWVKPYGEGRVFYCSFGHDDRIYFTPEVVQHFQDGVQFLLGDLKADTSPSVKPADK
jgi:type 1 glutamine amidotransferase